MRAQVITELGVGTPGAFEGLGPFDAWLCANIDDCTDESSGDVEAPSNWFARAGRRIVMTDNFGFWYVTRYESVAAAHAAYSALEDEYGLWASEPDEDAAP